MPPISRNPKIAYLFFETGLVEERGIGMKELKALKSKGFKKPDFKIEDDLFYTTIYRANDETAIKNIAKDNAVKLTVSEQIGFEYLKEIGELSSSTYAEKFSVDVRTARRHLNKIVDAGLATREGEGPATIYKIIIK